MLKVVSSSYSFRDRCAGRIIHLSGRWSVAGCLYLSLSLYLCAHYSQPANTTTHDDDMPLQFMTLNDASHMVLRPIIITSHTA